MKRRLVFFFLVFTMILCFCFPVSAKKPAGGFSLPNGLSTVYAFVRDVPLPDDLPGVIPILSFSVEDGMVHLQLGEKVPKLRILEQNKTDETLSTIYSRKNVDSVETYIIGEEDYTYVIRMGWQLGNMEYMREYTSLFGEMCFSRCIAEEKLDASSFGAYTEADRVLVFRENGGLSSETYTIKNEKSRFIRTVCYNQSGSMVSVELLWDSVDNSDKSLDLILDAEGALVFLKYQDKKNIFTAASKKLKDERTIKEDSWKECPNPSAFLQQFNERYPILEFDSSQLFDINEMDYGSINSFYYDPEMDLKWNSEAEDEDQPHQTNYLIATATDLAPATQTDLAPATQTDLQPATMTDLINQNASMDKDLDQTDSQKNNEENSISVPDNARIWFLSTKNNSKAYIYAFVTEEPVLNMKNGKIVLNKQAKDIIGEPLSTYKKLKPAFPFIELPIIERH